MRFNILPLVLACCVLTTGCGTAKINELTKKVEQLQDETMQLKAELQTVQKERDELMQKMAQAEEIRNGYEEARGKFQKQLAGLQSVLGDGAPNPLPPFDELKSSEWVGKLMPGAATDLGNLKDLEELKGELLKSILGGEPKDP